MNSERLWIIVLVLVAFASGLAAGILLAPKARSEKAFAPYLERLVDDFELNAIQERDLRSALAEYEGRIDRLRDESLHTKQSELIAAGEDCFFKIREYIIPIDRRAEFDRLLGGPLAPGTIQTEEIH